MMTKTGLLAAHCECVACRTLRFLAIELAIDLDKSEELTASSYANVMEAATRVAGFALIHSRPEAIQNLLNSAVDFRNAHAKAFRLEPWVLDLRSQAEFEADRAKRAAAAAAPAPAEGEPVAAEPSPIRSQQEGSPQQAWGERVNEIARAVSDTLNAQKIMDKRQASLAIGLVLQSLTRDMGTAEKADHLSKITAMSISLAEVRDAAIAQAMRA